MSDRDSAQKTKELFELLGQALDARTKHILENEPEDEGYYPTLKALDQEMWSAHSRWQESVLSS
jgi:hypothetical protein